MRCAQTDILVGLIGQPGATQENILGAGRSESHMLAAFHVGEIDRTRPVTGRVDETALVGVVAHSAFDIDGLLPHFGYLHTIGGSAHGRKMTARREARGGDEGSVEPIVCRLTANETDDGLDVVDLCRPLCIAAGTVIGANHCITCVEQRLHDGTQVGSTLAAVGEPCTSVDVHHHGIGILLYLGEIDVASVKSLVIAGIIHVLPNLGSLQFGLLLKTAKTACRLSQQRRGTHENNSECE